MDEPNSQGRTPFHDSMSVNCMLLILEKCAARDDTITPSQDNSLHAKMEYLKTIEESLPSLLQVITRYRKCHKTLAKREKQLGRFMDDSGKLDKTSGGKVLRVTGQFLYFISKAREALDGPLDRLYQAVGTFSKKAVEDTLQTVRETESSRKVYVGSRILLNIIAKKLNMDNLNSLRKLEVAQMLMKQKKTKYDGRKLKLSQKIDVLSVSRCNLLSTKMQTYVDCLVNIFKEIADISQFAGNVAKNTTNQSLSLTLRQLLLDPSTEELDEGRQNSSGRPISEEKSKESEIRECDLLNFDEDKCPARAEKLSYSASLGVLDNGYSHPLEQSSERKVPADENKCDMFVTHSSGVPCEEMKDYGSCLSYLTSQNVASSYGPDNLSSWIEILNEFDPLNQKGERDAIGSC